MNVYLVAPNAFIQARNPYYGFDFRPACWNWLFERNVAIPVASFERVADELQIGDLDLTDGDEAWDGEFFLPPDDAVLPALRAVSDWASGHGISASRRRNFSTGCRLSANCPRVGSRAYRYIALSAGKTKIPNGCIELGLRCINFYKLLRRECARFVLITGRVAA